MVQSERTLAPSACHRDTGEKLLKLLHFILQIMTVYQSWKGNDNNIYFENAF